MHCPFNPSIQLHANQVLGSHSYRNNYMVPVSFTLPPTIKTAFLNEGWRIISCVGWQQNFWKILADTATIRMSTVVLIIGFLSLILYLNEIDCHIDAYHLHSSMSSATWLYSGAVSIYIIVFFSESQENQS